MIFWLFGLDTVGPLSYFSSAPRRGAAGPQEGNRTSRKPGGHGVEAEGDNRTSRRRRGLPLLKRGRRPWQVTPGDLGAMTSGPEGSTPETVTAYQVR